MHLLFWAYSSTGWLMDQEEGSGSVTCVAVQVIHRKVNITYMTLP